MDHPEAGAKWKRVVQIAALALVWGIGILAVVCERSGDGPAHHTASARVVR
jgi:hypothetical protein